jgi:hypothetical protein
MLTKMSKYFSDVPPIYIDGALYSGILIFGFLVSYFSSDEAEKYISAVALFWLKGFFGLFAAWFGGIKMFRSNAYAEHQEKKKLDDAKNPQNLTGV